MTSARAWTCGTCAFVNKTAALCCKNCNAAPDVRDPMWLGSNHTAAAASWAWFREHAATQPPAPLPAAPRPAPPPASTAPPATSPPAAPAGGIADLQGRIRLVEANLLALAQGTDRTPSEHGLFWSMSKEALAQLLVAYNMQLAEGLTGRVPAELQESTAAGPAPHTRKAGPASTRNEGAAAESRRGDRTAAGGPPEGRRTGAGGAAPVRPWRKADPRARPARTPPPQPSLARQARRDKSLADLACGSDRPRAAKPAKAPQSAAPAQPAKRSQPPQPARAPVSRTPAQQPTSKRPAKPDRGHPHSKSRVPPSGNLFSRLKDVHLWTSEQDSALSTVALEDPDSGLDAASLGPPIESITEANADLNATPDADINTDAEPRLNATPNESPDTTPAPSASDDSDIDCPDIDFPDLRSLVDSVVAGLVGGPTTDSTATSSSTSTATAYDYLSEANDEYSLFEEEFATEWRPSREAAACGLPGFDNAPLLAAYEPTAHDHGAGHDGGRTWYGRGVPAGQEAMASPQGPWIGAAECEEDDGAARAAELSRALHRCLGAMPLNRVPLCVVECSVALAGPVPAIPTEVCVARGCVMAGSRDAFCELVDPGRIPEPWQGNARRVCLCTPGTGVPFRSLVQARSDYGALFERLMRFVPPGALLVAADPQTARGGLAWLADRAGTAPPGPVFAISDLVGAVWALDGACDMSCEDLLYQFEWLQKPELHPECDFHKDLMNKDKGGGRYRCAGAAALAQSWALTLVLQRHFQRLPEKVARMLVEPLGAPPRAQRMRGSVFLPINVPGAPGTTQAARDTMLAFLGGPTRRVLLQCCERDTRLPARHTLYRTCVPARVLSCIRHPDRDRAIWML